MRIWLREGVVEKVDDLISVGTLPGIKIGTSSYSGSKIIDIDDPWRVSADIVQIPEEFIERVTLETDIYEGFPFEGIYRLDEAELTIRTYIQYEEGSILKKQFVRASAPTVDELKDIFSQVRQGKLPPEERWDGIYFPPLVDDSDEENLDNPDDESDTG